MSVVAQHMFNRRSSLLHCTVSAYDKNLWLSQANSRCLSVTSVMENFEHRYLQVAKDRASFFLKLGSLSNDVFHSSVSSLYSDPFHRSQFHLHGFLTLEQVKVLYERIGLHDFIVNWTPELEESRSQ